VGIITDSGVIVEVRVEVASGVPVDREVGVDRVGVSVA
jgi:hypothetical protein